MKVTLILEEDYDSVAGVRFNRIRQGLQEAMFNNEEVAIAFRDDAFVFKIGTGVQHLELHRQVVQIEGSVFLGSLTKEQQ
jgi:hypothetical protein